MKSQETDSISSNSSSSSSFEYEQFWTLHVDTKPELPDEIFYIKNVYDDQSVRDFKYVICKIINRKIKDTQFFYEGQMLLDEHTLSFYGKNTSDVCIQHTIKRPSKKPIKRWFDALSQK